MIKGILLVLLAAFLAAGCEYGGTRAQGTGAPATRERDALRVRADKARDRLWVLGLDDVRVYDATSRKLIRRVALPNWSVARFICAPDMVLDGSGSAIVSSNVQPRLWRIDADSFEVKEQAISLSGRERWDVGFGALTFTADGNLLALTSSAGSLWTIDAGKGTARMIAPETTYLNTCELPVRPKSDF